MPPSRLARSGILVLLCVLTGCDRLWGGDFGNDWDAAMQRMHKIPTLFPAGTLQVESVWEPGEGITHTRFMYAATSPTCPEPMVTRICEETGSIRKTTGAKVEAWCHGTASATVERCEDGRRLSSLAR